MCTKIDWEPMQLIIRGLGLMAIIERRE